MVKFTPVGWIVFLVAVIMLVRSLINRNYYEIVLSSAVLLLLLVFGIIGEWKSRKLKLMEPAWKTPFPMTANTGDNSNNQTLVSGLDASVPFFFRLHFFIRGKFFPGGLIADSVHKGCPVSAETSVPRGETETRIPLDFPMSGIFLGDGFCRLRDIFGFFSFPCGQPQKRTVKIRNAPCFGKKTRINAQTGAEDQRYKPAADIERYYMREYTPGDRFRDINWKSSEKIDMLITRISTDNQEKVSRIEVHFRNYCHGEASLEALWLLDRAKSRLSYFLRSIMEENPSFIFDVRTASGNWEIEDMDDLEEFFEELAGLSFMPPQQEAGLPPGGGDVYVFSTACDVGLPAFLLTCNLRPVNLFMIQPEFLNKKKNYSKEFEALQGRDFFSKGIGFPLKLFVRGKVKPLSVQAEKTEMYYAGIKL